MEKDYKYCYKNIHNVKIFMNSGMTKVKAIKQAGFADPNLYYRTLKRLGLKEQTIIINKNFISFL